MTKERSATGRLLTPKQKVLQRAKDALCCYTGCPVCKWEIRAYGFNRDGHMGQLGTGKTPRAAWADAARFL
jgi:hypothetical protein